MLVATACGKASVEDRIDALLASGKSFNHSLLPSPSRMAVLYPGRPRESEERERTAATAVDADMRALVAAVGAAPELVRMLDDPVRRTLAVQFLAEIGGVPAENALLAQWRKLRDGINRKHIFRSTAGGNMYLGYHYEGDDDKFFRELLYALSYTGGHMSAEVARDTKTAMDEAERRELAGEKLRFDERRKEAEGTIDVSWFAEPVETACEGLEILGMTGAPDGVALFVRAIRSSIIPFRQTAVQNVTYLGQGKDQTLPALGRLLDDPKWRPDAASAIALLIDVHAGPSFTASASGAEWDRFVAQLKARLQELGHLPR
jgi:hypothetical protein